MTKLDIITPGPEIDDDPAAIALWNDTGNFIGSALARMERGRAFSIILARPLLACPGEGQEVSIEPQSPPIRCVIRTTLRGTINAAGILVPLPDGPDRKRIQEKNDKQVQRGINHLINKGKVAANAQWIGLPQ